MIGNVGMHATNNAHIVNMSSGRFGIEFADFDTGFTILLKTKRCSETMSGFTFSLEIAKRQWLTVVFRKFGLVVEGIDV